MAGYKGHHEKVKKGAARAPSSAEGGTGPRNAGEGETADLRHDVAYLEVVITMPPIVQQNTIAPLIKRTIAKKTVAYTDEYHIYGRLTEWGSPHHTVCHSAGEFARDEDGDGFCELHANTIEGFGRC